MEKNKGKMSSNDNLNFDSFSQISSKLGFLFGIDREACTLLIGARAIDWADDFKNYFSYCHKMEILSIKEATTLKKEGKYYNLIICDVKAVDLINILSLLRELLSSNGHLILIADNKYSIKKLKRQFLRKGSTSFACLGLKEYKRALKQSGFSTIRAFLPMPSIVTMEEIIAEHVKTFQLPVYYHPIYKFADKCGFYKQIHDGYIFVSSPDSEDGISRFLKGLQNELKDVVGCSHKFTLDRFDMRTRGALVLFVSDTESKDKFVVRVAVTPEIDLKIKGNASRIHMLLTDKKVLNEVKSKLPKPVRDFQYNGKKVYVEEMISGILAWKLIRNPVLRNKIDEEAVNFIENLNKSTRRYLKVDEDLFRSLFEENIKLLIPLTSASEEIGHAVEEMIAFLRDRMLGRTYPIVWTHGDFTYGNIIVHPQTGEIRGIIDWDGTKDIDLPGIDLVSIRAQALSHRLHCPILDGFKSVIKDILEKGELTLPTNLNPMNFSLDMKKLDLRVLIIAWVIRYIAGQAWYPMIITRHEQKFSDILVWIRNQTIK